MTARFFDGSRPGSSQKRGMERMRELREREDDKNLTPTERYKKIMQKKMDAHKERAMLNSRQANFSVPGAKPVEHEMSENAKRALKEMAMAKAAKQARRDRNRVTIEARSFGSSGRINKKGMVFDHVNNTVLKVNAKDGKIYTAGGMVVGKYNPKKGWFNSRMEGWIKQHSPYHIKLRKMQQEQYMMKMYGMGGNVVDVHGNRGANSSSSVYSSMAMESQDFDGHGNRIGGTMDQRMDDVKRARDNLGVTAWGVQSNNVWGNLSENVWGTVAADNIWGTASTNIWGGIGDAGSFMRGNPIKIWGSGRKGQKNYIKIGFGRFKARMGLFRRRVAKYKGRNRARVMRMR